MRVNSSGGTFNADAEEVEGARGLYGLYVPYATEESTGIPTAAAD